MNTIQCKVLTGENLAKQLTFTNILPSQSTDSPKQLYGKHLAKYFKFTKMFLWNDWFAKVLPHQNSALYSILIYNINSINICTRCNQICHNWTVGFSLLCYYFYPLSYAALLLQISYLLHSIKIIMLKSKNFAKFIKILVYKITWTSHYIWQTILTNTFIWVYFWMVSKIMYTLITIDCSIRV